MSIKIYGVTCKIVIFRYSEFCYCSHSPAISVSGCIKVVNPKGNEMCLDLFNSPSNNSCLFYAEQEACCVGNPTPIVSSISPLPGILQLSVMKGSREKLSH